MKFRQLQLEVNEDDIEEFIMGHEDELTIDELQEILNEEHQETQRNVSPSEQEEVKRGPMPISAIKDLLKKWEAVRAMLLEWHQTKLMSVGDEAHFWLNGCVNKQNCRIWSEANPQVSVATPLHPEKLTVWCALWVGGIIGPYFFKNDEGHNFQQDGAACHTAHAVKDTFADRLISRFGPVNWPPRSCDLTPLDYFLWGYVKSLVYADKPQTLDHLEDNIRRVIANIQPQMLEKFIENWTPRLDYIRASRGSHMPEIIFKM
ncbi:uncharacterized protein TNCV_4019211 [Trichonephila clavipes]|nr:uncharacterized protein TNCV_4019211 [Trichonephila clavipes]